MWSDECSVVHRYYHEVVVLNREVTGDRCVVCIKHKHPAWVINLLSHYHVSGRLKNYISHSHFLLDTFFIQWPRQNMIKIKHKYWFVTFKTFIYSSELSGTYVQAWFKHQNVECVCITYFNWNRAKLYNISISKKTNVSLWKIDIIKCLAWIQIQRFRSLFKITRMSSYEPHFDSTHTFDTCEPFLLPHSPVSVSAVVAVTQHSLIKLLPLLLYWQSERLSPARHQAGAVR